MIEIKIVLFIVFWHFLIDFWCQTTWQAQNKSKNLEALINHTIIYSSSWLILLLLLPNLKVLHFIGITFVCHTITDFITSKITSYYWQKENRYLFFGWISIDQFSHIAQLLLTYQLLK